MQTNWQDRVGAVVGPLGVAALFIAGGYYLVVNEFNAILAGLLGAAVLLLAAYAWFNPESIASAVTGRSFRYGTNATVMILALVGILAFVNVIGNRSFKRWDLTESREYSLSDQTIKVLAGLKQPVQVLAFYVDGDPSKQRGEDLLKEYVAHSDKISYEIVDPALKPGLVEQYAVRTSGTTVFSLGDKKQPAVGTDESEFTSALVKLTRDRPRKVGFLAGHGERDPNDTSNAGFSQVRTALERENYTIETVNLTTNPDALKGLDALVVAAPQRPLSADEVKVIKEYLGAGGKALIMKDPRRGPPLDDLIQDWDLTIAEGIAIDPRSALPSDPSAVVTGLGTAGPDFNPIIKDLLGSMAIFPASAHVKLGNPSPAITELAVTTEGSWLETDAQQAKYDEGVDTQGPLNIAVSVETEPKQADAPTTGADQSKKQTRLVVIANSVFATNAVLTQIPNAANQDFLVNAVNWLAESEDLISVRPKPAVQRNLLLTGVQSSLVLFSSVIFLPGIVLAAGIWTWWKRR